MATLAAILDQMADQVRGVLDDVTDVKVQVEPRMVLNPSEQATVDMYPGDPSTNQEIAAMGDLIGAELVTVRARLNTPDDVASQDLLLALMDDEDDLSLVLALNDEPSFNGLVSTMDIASRSGYTLFPSAQGDGVYLGFTLNVVVVKAHS